MIISLPKKTRRIHLTKLLAFPVVALALVTHHTFDESSYLDAGMETAGFILLVTAALGRLWAASYISGRKNAVLVTDGPYSIVRNPLYFFSFLGFVGAGLAFESWTLAALFGLLFFITHWPVIVREENYLRGVYGDDFTLYAERVPRFVPRPWVLSPAPALVSISPRLFGRAVMESALVLCVFLAAETVERIHLVNPATVLLHLP